MSFSADATLRHKRDKNCDSYERSSGQNETQLLMCR